MHAKALCSAQYMEYFLTYLGFGPRGHLKDTSGQAWNFG